MSYADAIYIQRLKSILNTGSTETGNVRAHWPDGTPAPTIRKIDVYTNYGDITEEFPILQCRPVDYKKAADEMIWIYQKKSSNVNDLELSHVWDHWADQRGDVGRTYGYQAGKVYYWGGKFKLGDQVDRAIWMIQNDPMSRHIIINLWNPEDYHAMNLAPCCCWLQFNVIDDKLNMVLYQRSLDMISAGGWDPVAHSLLLMMFAWGTGLKPGRFTHFVSNMHIYDRHIPVANKLIELYANHISPTPTEIEEPVRIMIDPNTPHDFYAITPDSFIIEGEYKPYGPQPKFEVAI